MIRNKYLSTLFMLLICLTATAQTQILIGTADDNEGQSPGLVGLSNDDFLYDGEYINHYGFGFHRYSLSELNGRNAYVSGYFGVDLFTGGEKRFRISANGNVGIGTDIPRFNLDIKTHSGYEGNNHYFGDRRYYLAGMTGNGTQMYGGFILNNLGSGKRAFEIIVDHDNDFDVNKSPANYIASFLSNGNVGINERDPKYRLTVGGIISASEVKVSATPNSDYVFEPDYPLLPLSEVESYIKENKHLPDIPSAEEFKQNGVGLGEMDDMLLRKIEELTLYVIEQGKNNEMLLEKIEELKKQNEAQTTEIEQLKNKLKNP